MDRGAFYALSCRVKLLSNLVIEEAKVPQDGRFTVDIKGSLYDIRVSTIPTNKGENLSLRLLYSQELDR
ncbi:ATPase, T2SS/T4P/T4SS family, partial [Bacteroides uniformis]|uniref:ATPase, T2SS/T4P/T4SS family n=1 Tax=Bacteroides uniformis TaxID=820 RepID=UPI00374E148A